ncbi:hypothetical protein ZWY2020_029925 [Hordeum vulgare]|nr:hypothetical protein ZWY2020_029925 [Hordeum vulgare]
MEASQSSIAMVPARCTAETQSSRATVAFKIAGYSLHKGLGRGKYLCSPAFSVGGYEWCIRYYPDGSRDETSQGHVSVFLKLLTKNAKVRARHNWMLVDPLSGRSIVVLFGGEPHVFDHESPSWGLRRFMKTTAEEESANVCNDCLVIECEVTVIKETFDVHVPPSDLSNNLATLLEGEKGADVTFKVQGEVFSAHKSWELMASLSRPREGGDTRWRVSFAAGIGSRHLRFTNGELLLRREALRLVLRDARGETIDARCLREGETLDIGDMVAFSCFFARIRDRLPEIGAPTRAAGDAASGLTRGTMGGDGGPTGGSGVGSAPHSASMADARHVGRDRAAHLISEGGISPRAAPRLDLEEAFSHFWSAPTRNPRSSERESFGWWRGKVGGDPRSFAAVTASPSPMGDGDRGFRGGRRGEPGRGARGPGPAPGRGGGRGGDRKFSWKRDDGDNNNSSTSNVASGSDETSRWQEAAVGKQTAEGGIWVPKSQGSSGSAGQQQIGTAVEVLVQHHIVAVVEVLLQEKIRAAVDVLMQQQDEEYTEQQQHGTMGEEIGTVGEKVCPMDHEVVQL